MVPHTKLRTLYKEAYQYLQDRIGKDALEDKLDYYRRYKAENMETVFWLMLRSLKNKRNMGQSIGDIDSLSPFLFDFDPYKTCAHYEDDWRSLFLEIKARHTPPGPMNIDNANSYWVIYVKGILSAAAFLNRFQSLEQFDEFVRRFSVNDISIAALPLLLDQEVYGLGFPLACDFLKECGYTDYAKPDVHIKAILQGCGLVSSDDNYEAFKVVIRMARACGEMPVIVDYVLWMIGSGRFVAENERISRQRAPFLQVIRSKWDLK